MDWTPVVELAGHVMRCFGDEHGRHGIEVFDVASGRSGKQFNPRSMKVCEVSLVIASSKIFQCL